MLNTFNSFMTDLQSKSMDWFLYDNGIRHERVNDNWVLKIEEIQECDVLAMKIISLESLHSVL